MRVFMQTDIEGVAGVVSFNQHSYDDAAYYEQSKLLLTREINAAAEGLIEEGIEEILVCDGHGPGGIVFEELHPAVKLMHGRPLATRKIREQVMKEYDVCVMIGQHAMEGELSGNLSHTQSSRQIDYYKLNGVMIGEIAQCALFCGALGVPLVFLSGDDAACSEAEKIMPGIKTVSVKQGLSRNSAISVSAPEARRRIKEGIKVAVCRYERKPLAPLRWEPPFILEKRYFHTDVADSFCSNDKVERIDSKTIRITSDNILDVIYS